MNLQISYISMVQHSSEYQNMAKCVCFLCFAYKHETAMVKLLCVFNKLTWAAESVSLFQMIAARTLYCSILELRNYW